MLYPRSDRRSDITEFSDIFPGAEGLGPLEEADVPLRHSTDPTGILPAEWFTEIEESDSARSERPAAAVTDPFASQTREPRVLGYDQRTLAELEHGLGSLRIAELGVAAGGLARPYAISAVPRATLTRLAREAKQEGMLGPDSTLEQRVRKLHPGLLPTIEDIKKRFIPGELPEGWEPILRQALRRKYYPKKDIDAIVDLTRQGMVPMISSMKTIPEYESSLKIRDTLSGFKVFGHSLLYLPPQISATLVKSLQGISGAGVVNPGRGSKLIQLAHDDLDGFARRTEHAYKNKKFLPGIAIKDLADLPRNMAFSLTSIGHGLMVGLPIAAIPIPGARVAAVGTGVFASGQAAYKMASYEVMQNYLELTNEDSIRERGHGVNAEEEKKLKSEFAWKARKYGLWEAIPEAVGNAAQVGTVFSSLNLMLGRSMATRVLVKMGGVYAEELFTESVTQIGQSQIEEAAGFPGVERKEFYRPTDWLKALQEVAPQTFLLTTVMGGAAATYAEVSNQLRSELGEDHDQFRRLLKKLRKRHPDTTTQAQRRVMTTDIETGKLATIKPKDIPKMLAIPARAQSLKTIDAVVKSSNYNAAAVKYLTEQGMTPVEITSSSEVARDIIFQRAMEIPFEQVAAKAVPESEALARMWDRMVPVEGDTVLIPDQQAAGTVRRYNNDGTIQVQLPSGVKMNVQPGHTIKAEGLDIARRSVQEVRAVTKPVKSLVPTVFSPTALASDMLQSIETDQLLTAISMVSDGEHTVMEAIEHLTFGNPRTQLLNSLAAEIGPEEFLDLAVDAVGAAPPVRDVSAPARVQQSKVAVAIQKAEETIQAVRDSIPATPESASQDFASNLPDTPEPYMTPLNTYLLTNAPPELVQLKNLAASLGFQSEQANVMQQYIRVLDRIVKKHMPERYDEFTQRVSAYERGDAKFYELDQIYVSEIHNRIAEIQFADEMEATGIADPMEAGMATHKRSVETALANRVEVSPEVLEQYPDLLVKYGLKEAEPPDVQMSLEEARKSIMDRQKQRMQETGQGTIPVGQSIMTVGPAGLPPGAKGDQMLADSMQRAIESHPDVARSLAAGDKALGEHSGARLRLTAWRRFIGEVMNPRMDKELRKTMPQYVDSKRTDLYTISSNAQVQALVDTGFLWGDLSKTQRDTVMRTIFLRSFLQTGGEGMDLPGKVELADVQQAYGEIQQVLTQQAPELLDVVDRYQDYMKALSNELVDRGWLKPEDVKNFYAPHIVIDYTPHYFLERPFVQKVGRQPHRPYLKKRTGTVRDIYANEEAILVRIAQINADIAFDDWVTGQLDTYDIYSKMTADAKLQYFGTTASGRVATPRPHGLYTVGRREVRGYQYIPGNMVYRADVVDRSLLATAFQDAMEDIGMAKTPADEKIIEDVANRGFAAIEKYLIGVGPRGGNALRSVRALGARNRTYLIPNELYDDMNRLTSKGVQGALTEVVHHLRTATKLWKTMATQISGGLPFHIRNLGGDWQNMKKTAGLGPFRKLPAAMRVLQHINDPSKLSPFEQRGRELVIDKDVIGSGLFRELAIQAFRAQKLTQADSALKFWRWYQKMSAYRELSNRVAVALYNLKRYEAGLPLKHFDIKAKELDGLDMESQIGYIARNFTSDYGDVPAWYRRYASGLLFPFATFHQKNAVNWAKLLTTPGKGRLKYLPMPVIENVVIPAAALYLWNHYGPYKEIEDGLGFLRRKAFHMNLYKWDDDGDGIADRGLTLAPELPADLALELIGADMLLENIDYVRRGVLSPREAAAKQIADFGMAPLRMGRRLLTPFAGALVDIVANNNPYTGDIVPKEEEALPRWDKLRHYWFPHFVARTITPVSQYLAEERGDEPPLFGIPWIRKPLDVLGGFGFHVVDLHKETDREWWQMRRYVSADRARQMRKFRNSYVKSGMSILEYIASEDAAKLLGETWRKDFAVQPGIEALRRGEVPTRGTLLGYLASPAVQLEALKKKLTRAGVSSEERIQINLRMRQLKELRRKEDFERVKFEEVPAVFRRLLMSADKKIQADNQRDQQ